MTSVGKPSLQCFTIFSTTCASSWTTFKGWSSVFRSAIAAKLMGAAMLMDSTAIYGCTFACQGMQTRRAMRVEQR